ncbi:MAG: hypothetical protein WHS38_01300 [Thermodesulforhabdaceae bacterium]
MKFCELVLRPHSAFGTPLKGDTIFGQFCWQAVMDGSLLNGGFEKWRDCYHKKPFAVFSSAFPVLRSNGKRRYYLPVPSCPLHFYYSVPVKEQCFEVLSSLKEIKSKRWVPISGDTLRLIPKADELLNDRELFRELFKEAVSLTKERILLDFSQVHNTIDRLSLTTGEGEFAPYVMENIWFAPKLELVVFVLFDEEATDVDRIAKGLSCIGSYGFGRDASIGLGRFDVIECLERNIPDFAGSKYCYALSPFVPAEHESGGIWYKPFVRFGRHGNILAVSRNPFKNPVLMADEGAVIEKSNADKPYIGKALMGLSKIQEKAIGQGYAIVIPCEFNIPVTET